MKKSVKELEKVIEFGGVVAEDWKTEADKVRWLLKEAKEKLTGLCKLTQLDLDYELEGLEAEWFAGDDGGTLCLKIHTTLSPTQILIMAFELAEIACQNAEIEL